MNPASESFCEIERRFLLASVPEFVITHGQPAELAQGYLAGHPVTVRLRRVGNDAFFLTVKRGALPSREEREVGLSQVQFDALWPMTEGWRIEKIRHSFPFEDVLIEVDVFRERHAGLIIAEVEFPSLDAATAFAPPSWFGREITDDSSYANSRLARADDPNLK